MIILGIEIKGSKICLAVYRKSGNEFEIYEVKSLVLENDDSVSIRDFKNEIFHILNLIDPNEIVIIERNKKGKFAAGAISWKIETIVQLYILADVRLISPAKIKAFFKDNGLPVQPKYEYNRKALQAAYCHYQLIYSMS